MGLRNQMQEIAAETIEISKNGKYSVGNRVFNFDTTNNTKLFLYGDFEKIKEEVQNKGKRFVGTQISVKNESTISAIFRLSKKVNNPEVGVLNFASAYNPGGGFETGAMAQEECLAYCSDLYLKQINGPGRIYYEKNRENRNPLYSDTMFMSNVTFFRNVSYMLIGNNVSCSVLTVPAVNMGAALSAGVDEEKAQKVMKNRMRKLLYVFAYCGCTDLILGAFGCGVFGNRPEDVAEYWNELLCEEGLLQYFKTIVFSIYDRPNRDNNVEVFKNIIGKKGV